MHPYAICASVVFVWRKGSPSGKQHIRDYNNSIVNLKGTSGGGVMAPVYDFIPLHVYWGPSNSKACIA
jgi:hypothetical protein